MKLPKSIHVGPYRYKVSTGQNIADGLVAQFRFEEQTIKVSVNCPRRQEPVALMHEIIHAADAVFKVDLKERQVELLAHGLAQALGSMGAWPETFE